MVFSGNTKSEALFLHETNIGIHIRIASATRESRNINFLTDFFIIKTAILYHGDCEWFDATTQGFQFPASRLARNQISYDCVPADVFEYPEKFGAKVFKVAYEGNDRLTFMKITGGSLKVKNSVPQVDKNGESHTEKVHSIRLYTGEKFKAEQELSAGSRCAVTGLNHTYPGQGLGAEQNSAESVLQAISPIK